MRRDFVADKGPSRSLEPQDTWPHTTRPLPWFLAGFLTMLFLVPIDGVKLKVPAPVDPYIDRGALVAVVGLWILVTWLGRRPSFRTVRPPLFLGATILFVSVALLSIVINVGDIARADLLDLSWNRLALLLAFLVFAFFAVAAMRPGELGNFSTLLVVLATLTAIGVIWERRTGFNVFYELIGEILNPIATVAPSPTDIHPDPLRESRKSIVGPTNHGLAVTAMLIMVMPFAVVRMMQVRDGTRWLYGLALTLILGAALSTERKTGVLTPVAAILVVAAYRPAAVLRLAPVGVVALALIHFIAPGALGTVSEFKDTFTSDSSIGRSDDYTSIAPEFLAHPLLGAGYGTRDIARYDEVRILDNEYLNELLTVGLIGLFAFIGMILTVMLVAHPAIRSGHATRAGPALAASASCAVFLVIGTLFDTMSFPQAPYVFFFIAAMATVVGSRELPKQLVRPVSSPGLVRVRLR